ncbi:MAG: hypothetical protein FWC76_08775 [Defluviitaleaceae bacterium]|nr:hypothetical protein [Defluviitaleaceae bacterium]
MELYDSKRKVVLVRGDKSKFYEQAIFILRPEATERQIDFVKEAEKIINASYKPPATAPLAMQGQKRPKRGLRGNIALNIALLAAGAAILAMLILNLL